MLEKHTKRSSQFQQEMKNTKLGMYPEEWSIQRLSDVTEVRSSNVDKKHIAGEQPVLLCNYMDVFNNDYIHNQMRFMEATATDSEIQKFALKTEDVIITKDSETREEIAEPCVVVEELKNVVCGYHLAVLRPRRDLISGIFLKDILRSPNVHQQFVRFANGITRFGLTLPSIRNALIPVPPLLEQHKIAEILGTWDEAIALTERRIEAARQRKRGLIQQLLTGRRRFKEFEATSWQETELGEFFYEFSERNKENKDLTVLSCSTIYGIVPQTQIFSRRIASENTERYKVVTRGDLVYDPMLLWDASIGFLEVIERGVVSPAYSTFKFKEENGVREYFKHLIKAHYLREHYKFISQGTNVRRRKAPIEAFLKLKVKVPRTMAEQRRVAAILQTCDREIELLTRKREALQRQKKGLMQRLLTGRVRVDV